jgi:hypothetical protein
MSGVCSLVAVGATVALLGRKLQLRGLAEWGTFAYTLSVSLLLVYGYLLSSAGLLGVSTAWLVASVLGVALAAIISALIPATPSAAGADSTASPPNTEGEPGPAWHLRLLLVPAGLTALAVMGALLFIACTTAPYNWDSLTCHLTRAAYYRQHGDLGNYPANFWGQTAHPRNQPILLVFAFLAGGENATQLVQFVAYLAVLVSVYGASRRLGARPASAALAAALTALWTNLVLEARTTQNDLLIAAGAAAATYFVLSFRQEPAGRYFWLTALALAGALGVKGSAALTLPPLGILVLWALWPYLRRPTAVPRYLLLQFVGAGLLLGLLLLPVGYVSTALAEGHPLGPAFAREFHTFERLSTGQAAREAGKNALRFGIDMVSLDGLPRFDWLYLQQMNMRARLTHALARADIHLLAQPSPGQGFTWLRLPSISENESYAGVCTLLFVIPALGYCLVRRRAVGPAALAPAAFGVFFLCQAFAGPYDPYRGRYFIWSATVVMPAVAVCVERWSRSRFTLLYLGPAVLLCCLSGVGSVLCYPGTPIPSTLMLDRAGQVTRVIDGFDDIVRAYEQTVPADATVAISLPQGFVEYPFFGRGWTRKLIPVPPRPDLQADVQATAARAQFLLYTAAVMPPAPDDLKLGIDRTTRQTVYLRRLHDVRDVPSVR